MLRRCQKTLLYYNPMSSIASYGTTIKHLLLDFTIASAIYMTDSDLQILSTDYTYNQHQTYGTLSVLPPLIRTAA